MKHKTNISLLILSLLTLLFTLNCSGPNSPTDNSISQSQVSEANLEKAISEFPVTELTESEKEGLVFMREEEKLARDVYLYLNDKYNLRVFKNISRSEQMHMNAIKFLLNRYDIEDPVGEDIAGSFKNEELQSLYNELIEKGNESEIEALKIGCAIEEIDILDLEHQLNEVAESSDVKFVYNNLNRGSGYHLKAFVWNLKVRGIEYVPKYLSINSYEEIIGGDYKYSIPTAE